MDVYPLMFESIYKEKPWGGRTLERLDRQIPDDKLIGESWDVIDTCSVRNGPLAGWTLAELVPRMNEALVGRRVWERGEEQFPLLLKMIDANETVSVQVHPDDVYAQRLGEPRGKSECWYVLHADSGGEIIHGFNKPMDRTTLKQAIDDDNLSAYLNRTQVDVGDTILVPAGTVHAICGGLLLYEVQQRSDTTYRLHDWGRMGLDGKPRDLHIEQSLDVMDFSLWSEHTASPLPVPSEDGRFYLAVCRYFALELWTISASTMWEPDEESFDLLTVVDGTLELHYGEYAEQTLEVNYGETVLVPAAQGLCRLVPASQPQCKLLRAYVPDLWLDVASPLLNAGMDREAILRLGGYGRQNDLQPLLVGR